MNKPTLPPRSLYASKPAGSKPQARSAQTRNDEAEKMVLPRISVSNAKAGCDPVVKYESVGQVVNRGRGRPKITEQRPWEAAGISRMTWYRRQKGMGK